MIPTLMTVHLSALSNWAVPRSTRTLAFEDLLHELVSNRIAESEDALQNIVAELTDEQIIYKKGEGPECVFVKNGCLIPQHGAILMTKYFIAKRVVLLRQRIGIAEIARSSFLDIGTTSGLFLRYLGKHEMGMNISPRAVAHTLKHGVDSITGNAEALPFPDKQFDYILSFQTLEHMENPIKVLQEMARVCRKRAYITVPHTERTRICSAVNIDKATPEPLQQHRWHMFEFSRDDLWRIMTRTNFRITYEEVIRVLGAPQNLRQRIFRHRFGGREWLQGFYFCELSLEGA